MAAQRYTLTAQKLEDEQVQLNGRPLKLQPNGELPQLEARAIPAGRVELAPVSVTFLAVPGAKNASCR
jgi:hypothetical protein